MDGLVLLRIAGMAPPGGKNKPGLSELCRQLLGAGLDKTCQCSDWEQRWVPSMESCQPRWPSASLARA